MDGINEHGADHTPGTTRRETAADVVLAEEQLAVVRAARPTTRVRISKRVVTEMVTRTVPVRREELVVESEDIDPDTVGDVDDLPARTPGFTIVLHEERVVLTTEVVATERVHVSVTRHEGNAEVSADLERERVELQTTATSDLTTPAAHEG